MNLETWLKEKAGLNGAKLSTAIKACADGLVTSAKDLLVLSEDIIEFKETFPQSMLRSHIRTALEKDKANIKAASKEPQTKNEVVLKDLHGDGDTSGTALPDGKR